MEEMHWWINLSKALKIQGLPVSPKINRIRGSEIAIIRVVLLCPLNFFLTKVMLFLIIPEWFV
jgi:hypothetical protein